MKDLVFFAFIILSAFAISNNTTLAKKHGYRTIASIEVTDYQIQQYYDCVECQTQEFQNSYNEMMSTYQNLFQANSLVLSLLGQSNYTADSVFNQIDNQSTQMINDSRNLVSQMPYGLFSNSLSNRNDGSANMLPSSFLNGPVIGFDFNNYQTMQSPGLYNNFGQATVAEIAPSSDTPYQRFDSENAPISFDFSVSIPMENQADITPYAQEII